MSPRLYNFLTALILLLTAGLAGWMGIVFANPASALNPFPPPTAAQAAHLVPVAIITVLPTEVPEPPSTGESATPPNMPAPRRGDSQTRPTDTPTVVFQTLVPPTYTALAPPSTGEPATPPNTPAGGFELGGQVAGFDHPDQMKTAGMVWVKRQLRWSPDANPNDAVGYITDAHTKGFKVLLSVLGDPESIRGGANYSDYAAYVGVVAALGADAIEVWNEMNIDREWPSGEISGAAYVELLRQAHAAIKAKSAATLVISGAPAPTGYYGGCTGDGCDDNLYVQGMVKAGALNHLDCIGIHYNEGILPPSQTSGDPRGNPNHYTRYYQTMIDTYYNAAGGRKQLCFTELGYLSGDGYSPALADVAPNFAWASDTSVDEQAQWLADAVRMAKNSSRIRLIIVFNVDFTAWGSDPQAGYAIIRPGGGCPACESLHGVTGGR